MSPPTSRMRNFMKNCWRPWRRPAALLWSDDSAAKSTHTITLACTCTQLRHFYRHAQTFRVSMCSAASRHMNIQTLCHFWTAELLEANRGTAAAGGKIEVFSTFFQRFEEAFLPFGFNKLWCHSEECRTRLQSASANHVRACEQRRVVLLPDELIDRLNSCFTFNHCRVHVCVCMWESSNVYECACLCVPGMALSYTF